MSEQMKNKVLEENKKLLEVINATVSHEIRNPLQAIIAQILLLDKKVLSNL